MGVPAKVYPNMGMYRSAVVGSLPSATPAAGETNDVSRKAAS